MHKVIELLTAFQEKAKKGKHEEEIEFAAFQQFCRGATTSKTAAIKTAGQQIVSLKANIKMASAQGSSIEKSIAQLDEDTTVWSADIKAATKVRDIEEADYMALHKDYLESIDALRRAITVLKKQNEKDSSLMQIASLQKSTILSQSAKQALDQFLAADPEVYDQQSGGIVDMLEHLLSKFEDELTALEKKEMNSKHQYDLLMQDLRAQIDQAKQDRGEKAGFKAKALQVLASANGDLNDVSDAKSEDEAYLSDVRSQCEQKSSDFESRQRLRAEEITTIQKAIEVLSGITGIAEKHLSSLLQASRPAHAKGTALTMLRAEPFGLSQSRAAQYLQSRSRDLHSHILSAVVMRVTEDPFNKVKKMIKDLVVRLLEEANEEAEHKGWCDTELSTNAQTRKEKTQVVQTLRSEIEELSASISKLGETITEFSNAIAELDASMAKATELRQKEKAGNEATMKDASDAQLAVAQAMRILRDFYAKSGDSGEAGAALLQQGANTSTVKELHRTERMGNDDVLAMLETIEADFARLGAETNSAEVAATKEYEDFMTDSKVGKAQKSKDIEHKQGKRQDKQQALTERSADLDGSQKELLSLIHI